MGVDGYAAILAGVEATKLVTFTKNESGGLIAVVGTSVFQVPTKEFFFEQAIHLWTTQRELIALGHYGIGHGVLVGVRIKQMRFPNCNVMGTARIGYFDEFSRAIMSCRQRLVAAELPLVPKLWLVAGSEY